jgi:hypothetical protein
MLPDKNNDHLLKVERLKTKDMSRIFSRYHHIIKCNENTIWLEYESYLTCWM